MEKRGFLEKLYQGTFDKELFMSCHGSKISDKGSSILDAYVALSKEYAPLELEEKIPSASRFRRNVIRLCPDGTRNRL